MLSVRRLRFCMQKRKIIENTLVASVMYLHVYMQKENIVGHDNAKCHVFALVVNLLTIVYPMIEFIIL